MLSLLWQLSVIQQLYDLCSHNEIEQLDLHCVHGNLSLSLSLSVSFSFSLLLDVEACSPNCHWQPPCNHEEPSLTLDFIPLESNFSPLFKLIQEGITILIWKRKLRKVTRIQIPI